jgi:hypothetical protein
MGRRDRERKERIRAGLEAPFAAKHAVAPLRVMGMGGRLLDAPLCAIRATTKEEAVQLVKEAVAYREQRERMLAERATEVLSGELVAHAVDLFKARALNWIQTRQGARVLSVGSGFVRLAPSHDDLWDVHYQENGREVILLRSALPLTYAQGVAEDFARKQGAGALLNPDARWRTEPATEKQLYHLRRNGVPISPGLTKGQAYDLLGALWGDSGMRTRQPARR